LTAFFAFALVAAFFTARFLAVLLVAIQVS
jgi:hypothetical protein